MTCSCPTCGQTLANGDGIRFDYDNDALVVNGTGVHLTPRQSDLLKVFFDAHPKTLLVPEIMSRIYGASGGPDSESIIRVLVSQLNKKFLNTGLAISSLPQRGYRITISRIGAAA